MADDLVKLTVQLTREQRREFQAACFFLGVSMSDVLRGAITATVAEARQIKSEMEGHNGWSRPAGRPLRVRFSLGEEDDPSS